MKAKRITALSLCALVLLSAVTSCSCRHTGEETTGTGSSALTIQATTDTSDTDSKGYVKDKLPDNMNLSGKVITVASVYERNNTTVNDDELKKATENRDSYINKRLNAGVKTETVTTVTVSSTEFLQTVRNAAASGDGKYDILIQTQWALGACAKEGLLYNLSDAKYLDLTAPWWPGDQAENSALNGKLYVVCGDATLSATQDVYCIFANTNVAKSVGYTDLVSLVNSHEWTTETFLKIQTDVKMPDNTDGSTKYFATYGDNSVFDAVFCGAGFTYLENNGGKTDLSSDITGEALSSFFEKYTGFCSVPSSKMSAPGASAGFAGGNSLFHFGYISDLENILQSPSFSVKVLPLPLYDSDQQNYRSSVSCYASACAITAASADKNAASAVLEAMASYGYRTTRPAYYTAIFGNENLKSTDNEKMFDLLHTTLVFDPVKTYLESFGSLYKAFRKVSESKYTWSRVCEESGQSWINECNAFIAKLK